MSVKAYINLVISPRNLFVSNYCSKQLHFEPFWNVLLLIYEGFADFGFIYCLYIQFYLLYFKNNCITVPGITGTLVNYSCETVVLCLSIVLTVQWCLKSSNGTVVSLSADNQLLLTYCSASAIYTFDTKYADKLYLNRS